MWWVVVIIIIISVFFVMSMFRLFSILSKIKRTKSDKGANGAKGKRSRTINYELERPVDLGLRKDVPLQDMERRLKQALPAEFRQKLKTRVLAKYPALSLAEYEWKLLELERYFMMNAVLRHVPMFSEPVDDIWHEMLMFTREYQQFSESFVGYMLHHAPHTEVQPMPGERAWFDWVYSHLFTATPFSELIWHGFCRNPLDPSRIEAFKQESPETLRGTYFNDKCAQRWPGVAETIDHLIGLAKQQIQQANGRSPYSKPENGTTEMLPYLAGAMMFYSITDADGFQRQMDELTPEKTNRQDGGSGCTSSSYDASSDSSNCDSGHHSSGDGGSSGDSGGSSCSSSSCGSGCGGGGD
ncbi:hypothetical protein [Paenibacillus eucommiae]|uniref:Uncharacterized protein n=1 Tax=Paenibacillus eucommiae TaxID=1355755 RepID=A0ABS4IWV9_9BACL|nr:hypothetical protein [Paenibacillus eucommiae]MBP1992057.1 hypothetical protein [Paenibacillus eucommiae]